VNAFLLAQVIGGNKPRMTNNLRRKEEENTNFV